MKAKTLEVRDAGTFIPVLCVDMNPDNDGNRYLLRRCGFPCDGEPNVMMTNLSCSGHATNDPYDWQGSRTYSVAHNYIIDNWSDLQDGDVVDVEYILGETSEPKISERETG